MIKGTPLPLVEGVTPIYHKLDTLEEAVFRRAAHMRLCIYYQGLAARFHDLMVWCRDIPPVDGAYPIDSVFYYQELSADLARMARSELWASLVRLE